MAYEQKEGFGSLFANKHRMPGSKEPHTRGEIKLGGVLYELAGWTREDKNGDRYVSLSGKRKQTEDERAAEHRAKPRTEDFDDEIPFA